MSASRATVGPGLTRVLRALQGTNLDVLLLANPDSVSYVTGYGSVAQDLQRHPRLAVAINRSGELNLAGPVADAASVIGDGWWDATNYVAYGNFYFESGESSPIPRMSGIHDDLRAAIGALGRGWIRPSIGVDEEARDLIDPAWHAELREITDWMLDIRAVKSTAELAMLGLAARITEDAIEAAIALTSAGVTELDLAHAVSVHMARAGMMPRFLVVTSGLRSAYSDASATTKQIESGDIVRFDVGGTLHGYWSDVARTAVVGKADGRQADRYAAVLAGQQAQLDAARPGVKASDLFVLAVRAVEESGLSPYRRHHCGHGLGRGLYERPVVVPGNDQELREGMVLCLETPYYELGWGGVMVEDTVRITSTGCERLTTSSRALRCT